MNNLLETAIAVLLVIIVFSIITYVLQELIAANLQFRGKMLQSSIKQLLDGNATTSAFTNDLFNHPQIKLLQEDLKKIPSYVPSANFALAIMDLVAKKTDVSTSDLFKDFKTGVTAFSGSNGDFNILLKNWADNSANLKELQDNIEKWFNSYMDRVTGWYKNKSTIITRWIAIGVTLFFNLNMIVITQAINSDSALKAKLIASAEQMVTNQQAIKDQYLGNIDTVLSRLPQKSQASIDSVLKRYNTDRINSVKSLLRETNVTELPIGWNRKGLQRLFHLSPQELLWLLLGWFIGAATISMGAPFWFDLLIKLVNVRRSGLKPEPKNNN